MGLDMFLYGVKYFSKYDKDENGNKKRNKTKISKTEEMYWRKANQIHKWFVENIQNGQDDCKTYELNDIDLKILLNLCKQVKENNNLASELLPTQEGFFFGGTEYDEYYFEDINYTIENLERILNIADKYDWFEYNSWW